MSLFFLLREKTSVQVRYTNYKSCLLRLRYQINIWHICYTKCRSLLLKLFRLLTLFEYFTYSWHSLRWYLLLYFFPITRQYWLNAELIQGTKS